MPALCQHPLGTAVVVAVALLPSGVWAQSQAEELRSDYERLSAEFSSAAPGWRPPSPATGSLLFIAPDQYTPAGHEGEAVRNARNQYADALFQCAEKAAEAGQFSLAFQWATEAVRENPTHAEARRVLGYQQRGNLWLTAYAARMADSGKIWHADFGWIAPSDIARYEAGERFVGGRWISAEDDAARHTRMTNGWQVRTDRFLVTTNHSLEAATDLAVRLERLYQVWRQLFAGFYLPENEVPKIFAGERQPRSPLRPFRVYYHRDRQEYISALRHRQPRIAETLGIYFDTNRQAHFFAGSNQDAGTLYHEAVHQLFQESKRSAARIGDDANFWVIEGVATYFETLSEHSERQAGLYYTVGESSSGRLPAARERLRDGYYVPLADLTQLGKAQLQRRADLAKLYSQAAGLSAFLMDADQGRYREPLVRYLDAVYTGRDDAQSLEQATGASFHELDARYRRYIESLP